MFSDCVLKDFTYFGLRNKYNFSTLLINKIIFGNNTIGIINLNNNHIIMYFRYYTAIKIPNHER